MPFFFLTVGLIALLIGSRFGIHLVFRFAGHLAEHNQKKILIAGSVAAWTLFAVGAVCAAYFLIFSILLLLSYFQ